MQNSQILINPITLPVADRSVQYGDASFTTMYAEQGRISLFDAHIKRLQLACKALDIHFYDWQRLQDKLTELASIRQEAQVIKVIISRGSGGRGYQPPESQNASCIVSQYSADLMLAQGDVNLLKVSQLVLPTHDRLEGVKHNNRLAQVMAKQEAVALACDDVLMCDNRQHVIETSSANLFYKLDDCWYTPSLNSGGVKGVMRDAFIDYLQSIGAFVNYANHHITLFSQAQNVLLTNAVRGVRQVRQLDYNNSSTAFDTSLGDLIEVFTNEVLNVKMGM